MTDQSGLFGKYVVFKADTEQMVTDFCFVLKPETDPIAWDTLQFYAEHTADGDLSDDLLEWLGAHPKPGLLLRTRVYKCRDSRKYNDS